MKIKQKTLNLCNKKKKKHEMEGLLAKKEYDCPFNKTHIKDNQRKRGERKIRIRVYEIILVSFFIYIQVKYYFIYREWLLPYRLV